MNKGNYKDLIEYYATIEKHGEQQQTNPRIT